MDRFGLNSDFESILSSAEKAVEKGLSAYGSILKDSLRQHIEDDVYAVYKPKVYERRSDNPALGRPLSDVDGNSTVTIAGSELIFEYLPSGEHEVGRWSTADGDKLIDRIETGEGYDYDFSTARPFFSKFTEEQIEGGGLNRLIEMINAADSELEIREDGSGIIRDGRDY